MLQLSVSVRFTEGVINSFNPVFDSVLLIVVCTFCDIYEYFGDTISLKELIVVIV